MLLIESKSYANESRIGVIELGTEKTLDFIKITPELKASIIVAASLKAFDGGGEGEKK